MSETLKPLTYRELIQEIYKTFSDKQLDQEAYLFEPYLEMSFVVVGTNSDYNLAEIGIKQKQEE